MPKRANFRERRQKRQDEAKVRGEARAKRSNADQLRILDSREGESRKERAKLANEVET